jgi:uracil-DNA glycosylase
MVGISDKSTALRELEVDIVGEDPTPLLRQGATQLVFGAGSPDATLVFVGEAPGKQEDLTGVPFVGASGKLLNQLLASINLQRADIYITNIVKYRPPSNRDPSKVEIAAFVPYLKRQIDIIRPRLVVFLGRHAMKVFLPELTISDAHGMPVVRGGQTFLPLYHPAAALYNGGLRQTLMDDFAKIPVLIR